METKSLVDAGLIKLETRLTTELEAKIKTIKRLPLEVYGLITEGIGIKSRPIKYIFDYPEESGLLYLAKHFDLDSRIEQLQEDHRGLLYTNEFRRYCARRDLFGPKYRDPEEDIKKTYLGYNCSCMIKSVSDIKEKGLTYLLSTGSVFLYLRTEINGSACGLQDFLLELDLRDFGLAIKSK